MIRTAMACFNMFLLPPLSPSSFTYFPIHGMSLRTQSQIIDDPINLVWAVEADLAQLGACLKAYAETKAAVTAFKACVSHTTIQSMSRAPPEIVALIADALQDRIYSVKFPRWLCAQKCLSNTCRPRDHFTRSELSALLEGVDWDYSPKTEDECLLEELVRRHLDTVIEHTNKLLYPDEDEEAKMFESCKKVNAAEQSLKLKRSTANEHVYRSFLLTLVSISISPFCTRTSTLTCPGTLRPTPPNFSAYLTIPIAKAPIESEPETCGATYRV